MLILQNKENIVQYVTEMVVPLTNATNPRGKQWLLRNTPQPAALLR